MKYYVNDITELTENKTPAKTKKNKVIVVGKYWIEKALNGTIP